MPNLKEKLTDAMSVLGVPLEGLDKKTQDEIWVVINNTFETIKHKFDTSSQSDDEKKQFAKASAAHKTLSDANTDHYLDILFSYVLKDELDRSGKEDNYATGIERDEANKRWILHAKTKDGKGQRWMYMYDNSLIGKYDIDTTKIPPVRPPSKKVDWRNELIKILEYVGAQLYIERVEIFSHFKISLPSKHEPDTISSNTQALPAPITFAKAVPLENASSKHDPNYCTGIERIEDGFKLFGFAGDTKLNSAKTNGRWLILYDSSGAVGFYDKNTDQIIKIPPTQLDGKPENGGQVVYEMYVKRVTIFNQIECIAAGITLPSVHELKSQSKEKLADVSTKFFKPTSSQVVPPAPAATGNTTPPVPQQASVVPATTLFQSLSPTSRAFGFLATLADFLPGRK